ncbi:hypothetical protein OG729_00150 [Streptomyces sp. NBC_00210]|uniref:hypothetical protein n=1 Tax=unclassified Streptomyces TaxID=2593676 RepID=UPI0032481CCB
MNTVHSLMLAGQLDDLGDSWINMFKDWATKALQAGLVCLVVIIMIQKFSLKAGIGALLLMITALGHRAPAAQCRSGGAIWRYAAATRSRARSLKSATSR